MAVNEDNVPTTGAVPGVDENAVRQLAEAVAHLNNDSEWFLHALTEYVRSLRPITKERLSKAERRFLIDSGVFSPQTLADTEAEVDRGSLHLNSIEGWLTHLLDTISRDEAAAFLHLEESEVARAVDEGRLYAVELSGRQRFPRWQFDVSLPEKVIPHLPEVIRVVSSRWESRGVAAFMATPQADLVGEGRKTPVAWLRDGGDIRDVVEIVEADDWW